MRRTWPRIFRRGLTQRHEGRWALSKPIYGVGQVIYMQPEMILFWQIWPSYLFLMGSMLYFMTGLRISVVHGGCRWTHRSLHEKTGIAEASMASMGMDPCDWPTKIRWFQTIIILWVDWYHIPGFQTGSIRVFGITTT